MKAHKSRIFATSVLCSLLTASVPNLASARCLGSCCYGNCITPGQAFGLGVLGGVSSALTQALIAPSQPYVVYVPVPSTPAYLPPPASGYCRTYNRWYPDVTTCPVPWTH